MLKIENVKNEHIKRFLTNFSEQYPQYDLRIVSNTKQYAVACITNRSNLCLSITVKESDPNVCTVLMTSQYGCQFKISDLVYTDLVNIIEKVYNLSKDAKAAFDLGTLVPFTWFVYNPDNDLNPLSTLTISVKDHFITYDEGERILRNILSISDPDRRYQKYVEYSNKALEITKHLWNEKLIKILENEFPKLPEKSVIILPQECYAKEINRVKYALYYGEYKFNLEELDLEAVQLFIKSISFKRLRLTRGMLKTYLLEQKYHIMFMYEGGTSFSFLDQFEINKQKNLINRKGIIQSPYKVRYISNDIASCINMLATCNNKFRDEMKERLNTNQVIYNKITKYTI